MKIWKITAEIATLDNCDADRLYQDIIDITGGGNVHCVDILEQKLLYGGEKPAKASPKKSLTGLSPADGADIVPITTSNLLKPKRKYTRRAKVVPGDIPAHERPPANQPNGTTVVQVHEDGTKTENRK